MPNSGSMEAFEKIGAMCSSASKKEGASWLGGLPPNGRSTSGGGREAVWRLHWLDPARSRLGNIIGWACACGLSRSNWNCQSKRMWKKPQREGWHAVDAGVSGGGSRHFLLEILIASAWGEYQLVFTFCSLVSRGYASQGMDSGVAGTEATVGVVAEGRAERSSSTRSSHSSSDIVEEHRTQMWPWQRRGNGSAGWRQLSVLWGRTIRPQRR